MGQVGAQNSQAPDIHGCRREGDAPDNEGSSARGRYNRDRAQVLDLLDKIRLKIFVDVEIFFTNLPINLYRRFLEQATAVSFVPFFYSFKQYNQPERNLRHATLAVKDNYLYQLTVETPEENYSISEPIFQHVIHGFYILA